MSHIDLEDSPPAGFRILDLFAGPGGLDVAADVLGHQVTGIEWDAGACATRRAAGMSTFQGDVRRYRAAFFPHAQVLTGGPPCQTFTVAGHGAGRRSLDQVVEYIRRLHEAVRAEGREWREIFRTWRGISEELRRKELKARDVKARKRRVEELRAVTRKALKLRLQQLGNSADEVTNLMKRYKGVPQSIAFSDDELDGLLKEFSDLNDEHAALKHRLEELGDERTGLVLQPLWWVIERSRRPGSEPYEAIVLEQVPAVLPVWEEYAKVLASLGYRTGTQLMHTEAFGVPQTRRRAVLMARLDRVALLDDARRRLDPLPPVAETHERYQPSGRAAARPKSEPADTLPLESPKAVWVPMEAALKRAREIKPELPARPPFTVISNYGTGGVSDARGRRDHDVPSATITGKVSRNRVVLKDTETDIPRFLPAEAGVLQTFPVAYPWEGNDVSQQIGNAVPPRLALHVLRHVLEPELSDEEARTRMKQATADLEAWTPGEPVEIRRHGEWKGHPLTGR